MLTHNIYISGLGLIVYSPSIGRSIQPEPNQDISDEPFRSLIERHQMIAIGTAVPDADYQIVFATDPHELPSGVLHPVKDSATIENYDDEIVVADGYSTLAWNSDNYSRCSFSLPPGRYRLSFQGFCPEGVLPSRCHDFESGVFITAVPCEDHQLIPSWVNIIHASSDVNK